MRSSTLEWSPAAKVIAIARFTTGHIAINKNTNIQPKGHPEHPRSSISLFLAAYKKSKDIIAGNTYATVTTIQPSTIMHGQYYKLYTCIFLCPNHRLDVVC